MSLRIWLPLNGHLNNKGCSDLNAVSVQSGCGTSNDGKLGVFETNREARETIAIRVSGDSMAPKIDDRNTVTVHVQKSFRNGDIIALTIEDKKNIYVRRARRDGSDIILEPGNSEYDTMRYNEEQIHIIGVVKKIVKTI